MVTISFTSFKVSLAASDFVVFTIVIIVQLSVQTSISSNWTPSPFEYTPRKCFNSFVQLAVDARRQGEKNPNSKVVADKMKLLQNKFYSYQIVDRIQHTVIKYLNDEKTHAAINSKMFKKLNHVNNALNEVELAKAEFEHKEPIIVRFLQPSESKTPNAETLLQLFR